MVNIYSAHAPTKDTKERMVFHMSYGTTRRSACETTFCIGWLMNRHQANRGRESSHEVSPRFVALTDNNRLIGYSFQLGGKPP